MSLIIDLIFLVSLILLSAFFSGTEVALVSVNKLKVRNLIEQKKKGAESLKNLKDNPEKMLTTILIGNNIVNITASAYAAVLATKLFEDIGIGVAIGIMTVLILIFGEIVPKTFATTHSIKLALFVARPILLLQKILFPLIFLFEKVSHFISRIFKTKEKPLITEDEFKTIVDVGVEEKVLDKDEKELIEGVLEFDDTRVKEVMTPRINMFTLNENMKVKKAIGKINESVHSRIPIYSEGDMNKIVGVIHIKEILKALEENEDTKLIEIARKPFFTSKETIIGDLFKEMQRKRKHLALVVNEFGGVAGLVTMEDLLEEIVGEIEDESDNILPESVVKIDDANFMVHGETEIDTLEDNLNIELPDEGDYVTVSGLLHYHLKEIPKKGSKVKVKNLLFNVLEVVENKPTKVKITKI